MKIEELKNNIPELCAAVRVVVRKYHHTKKFVKHIVALVLKQLKNLTDVDLAEFVVKDGWGRLLGYKTKPHPSVFSKVRDRSDPEMLKETYDLILQTRFKGRNLRLIVQDSASVAAHSMDDSDARYGHRTPRKGNRKLQGEMLTRCSLDTRFT